MSITITRRKLPKSRLGLCLAALAMALTLPQGCKRQQIASRLADSAALNTMTVKATLNGGMLQLKSTDRQRTPQNIPDLQIANDSTGQLSAIEAQKFLPLKATSPVLYTFSVIDDRGQTCKTQTPTALTGTITLSCSGSPSLSPSSIINPTVSPTSLPNASLTPTASPFSTSSPGAATTATDAALGVLENICQAIPGATLYSIAGSHQASTCTCPQGNIILSLVDWVGRDADFRQACAGY